MQYILFLCVGPLMTLPQPTGCLHPETWYVFCNVFLFPSFYLTVFCSCCYLLQVNLTLWAQPNSKHEANNTCEDKSERNGRIKMTIDSKLS